MYYLIESNDDKNYQSLPSVLDNADYVAVDTEFERRNTYYPIPSLLQIGLGEKAYLVDLTKVDDYTPLQKIFSDQNLIKVLHSGYQDFEILHNLNIEAQNCFDSQVAMSFIGLHEKQSFEVLVTEILGQNIDKSQQNSKWIKRPLSPNQLEYAAQDVILLFQCYPEIKKRLAGNYSKCVEDCQNLVYNPKILQVNYIKMLSPFIYKLRNQADIILAYHTLCYRENKASSSNKVRQRIIRDDKILEMIKRDALPAEIKKYAASADEAKAIKIIEQAQKFLNVNKDVSALQAKLIEAAKNIGLPPQLIASKKDLVLFANNLPSKLDSGWRAGLITRG